MAAMKTGGNGKRGKTVLLLGAGLTRAAAMSQAEEDLPKAEQPPLDTDFFDIAHATEKDGAEKVIRRLHELVGDYSEFLVGARSGSLETAASCLYLKARERGERGAYRLVFLELLELLARVLAKTTNPINSASLPYRFLRSELGALESPEDLTTITFNYDLPVERALDEIARSDHAGAFRFPGCYRLPGDAPKDMMESRGQSTFENMGEAHSGVAVLKLHGSLNWLSPYFSPEMRMRKMFSTS